MKDDEPDHHAGDLWAAYLDFYRRQICDGVLGLPVEEQRRSRLPSGWSPLELLSHCVHMEQRWFVWSFLGEAVDEPWGDWDIDDPWRRRDAGRWQVPDDVTAEVLAERLAGLGRRTAEVLAAHRPDELARAEQRFDGDPPTLQWICFHVLQEYARHAGHLDIAVELAGGDS